MKFWQRSNHAGSAGAARRNRRRCFVVAAAFFGIAVGLGLMELVLRLLGIGYGSAPLVSDAHLHHAHEKDYAFLCHTPSGEFGGFPVRFDAEGWVTDPDGRSVFAPDRHRRLVALLGDSFVEALQVPYAASLVGRLNQSARPDVFVRNYGVSSYSPVLYLQQWRRQVRLARPNHVLLLLYANDIRDDEHYAARAQPGQDGLPASVPGPGNSSIRMALRRLYVARLARKAFLTLEYFVHERKPVSAVSVGGLLEENPALKDLTKQCLSQLAKEIRETGARFTLLAVPSKYEMAHPGQQVPGGSFAAHVRVWAEANGVEFLDLTSHFEHTAAQGKRLFFERDIHFNHLGHAVAALAVVRRYPELFQPESR